MPKPRPMRIEDLFSLKAVGRVAISPDGRRVIFELKRHDDAENQNFTQLMLADADGGVRPLTAAGKYSDSLPRWSPDGACVAFLSSRQSPSGLYMMSMSGGDPRRLTDREGSVDDFTWSPDGRRIAFTYRPLNAREKLERDGKQDEVKRGPQFKHITRLHHKLDGAGFWNGEYQHIFVIRTDAPLERAKAKQLTRGAYDDLEPRWSPRGDRIAFRSNRIENYDLFSENSDLYVVSAGGGAMRRLTQGTGACQAHSWSPDGAQLAFVGNRARREDMWKHLARVHLVDARGGPRQPLTTDLDNHCVNTTLGDVGGAGFAALAPLWSADGNSLLFSVSEEGCVRLYRRALSGRRSELLIGGELNIMFADQARPDGPIALSIGHATSPGDIFVLDSCGGAALPRRISDVNGDLLRRVSVSEPQAVRIRSDGVQVHAWELRPPGFDPRRKYPAILQIHGGPHTQYGSGFFHEMQWLAARGYVIVFGNPRGSTGYGLKYQTAIHADWGNKDYRDVMRIADWLFSRPYVDRKRVGVTGGSYGGFMTNWIIGNTQRFRAAVTQRSVVNMVSMFGSSDFGYELGAELGGTPWDGVERLRKQSPLRFVKKMRTPLLIDHQESDLRCPIEQGEQLFSALKLLGRTVEMVRFEGESHGMCRIGRPQNRAERLRRIGEWFDRWMK